MPRIILFVLLVLTIPVAFYLVKVGFLATPSSDNVVTSQSLTAARTSELAPTPTPMPFEEMTIPYLRKQDFKSSLSNLEKVSENQSYTSYLTSYTSEGFKINGLLTQPKGGRPEGGWPAIIFVHGYIPPAQYQTLTRYVDHVNYLARNGFVVFKIDLRGHGDSQGEPGGGYFSSEYIKDILNAYSALEESDFVNSKKIGLWGHSMAGNLVLRTMAAKPEIPAGVVWAGAVYTYTDLAEFGISDSSYVPLPQDSEYRKKRQKISDTYGEPEQGHPFWKLVAPSSYLNDLKGAVSLNHAQDDNVVDKRYSENLDSLLDKTSVPHELNIYPSGGHNITGASFTQAMENTVNFFKEHLEAEES